MTKKDDHQKKDKQHQEAPQKGDSPKAEAATDNMSPEEVSEEESPEVDMNEEMIERIKELEARVAESHEKHLRLFSEFDNYRKRTSRERLELSKTASAEMITALLPVVDDMERALQMVSPEDAEDAAVEGFRLIYNKRKSILSQKGVEEISAVGEDFDTDFHEAITHIPATEEHQKGKVVEQVQKGYILNGKVIRFDRVVVAN